VPVVGDGTSSPQLYRYPLKAVAEGLGKHVETNSDE
jgi:hypothetical protein